MSLKLNYKWKKTDFFLIGVMLWVIFGTIFWFKPTPAETTLQKVDDIKVSIRIINFGWVASGAYITVVNGSETTNMRIFAGPLDINKSGTTTGSAVELATFSVSPEYAPWLADIRNFEDEFVDIELGLLLLGKGQVDLSLVVFTRDGYVRHKYNRLNLKAVGFQFANTAIRGKIKFE